MPSSRETNAPQGFFRSGILPQISTSSLTTKAVSVAVLSFWQKLDTFLGRNKKIFKTETTNEYKFLMRGGTE